jgi:hypothetical protein
MKSPSYDASATPSKSVDRGKQAIDAMKENRRENAILHADKSNDERIDAEVKRDWPRKTNHVAVSHDSMPLPARGDEYSAQHYQDGSDRTQHSNQQAIATIISQTTSAASCREALHTIMSWSGNNDAGMWNAYFGQVLLAVLETFKSTESGMRELALQVIREMLRNQAQYFDQLLEVVFRRVLDLLHDSLREVTQAAEETLDDIVAATNPKMCLEILTAFVRAEEPPILQMCIRLSAKLCKKMESSHLMEQLAYILPGLFEAFKSPSAEVRKAVVFCLVDLYQVLGDRFTPYLSELNTSQVKLVTIYINRMAQARQARAGVTAR